MEPYEVRIGQTRALVEIDQPDSPNWKGVLVEGAALDEGEVTITLLEEGRERTSRAHVVVAGAYVPPGLEGLEPFH